MRTLEKFAYRFFFKRADIEYDGNSGSLSPPFDIESEEKLHSLAEEERSLAEVIYSYLVVLNLI